MRGLKVIGAGTYFPDSMVGSEDDLIYSAFRPKARLTDLAMDYVLPACDQALTQAGIEGSQIDLIVNMSVSPDHIAIQRDICAPRLGYPLQMELAAKNSYVLDAADSDMAFALDLAQGMCEKMGFKTALIVRSECAANSIASDRASGFDIADGAGVLIVQLSAHETPGMRYADLSNSFEGCSIFQNQPIRTLDGTKGRFDFPGQENLVSAINCKIDEMLSQVMLSSEEDFQCDMAIVEKWFAQQNVAFNSEKNRLFFRDSAQMTSFYDLPFWSHHIIENELKGRAFTYSIDPFRMRIGQQCIYF